MMKLVASKVHCGNEPWFNPMLEEKCGWTSNEVQRQDVVMVDAVIEGLPRWVDKSNEVTTNHSRDNMMRFCHNLC